VQVNGVNFNPKVFSLHEQTPFYPMGEPFFADAFGQASKFNPREIFGLNFYPNTGNDIRSANGSPGPRYWQNRADYKIAVTLDTAQHKISW
jgi:hypothetical protein